jgi:hypothetical protein
LTERFLGSGDGGRIGILRFEIGDDRGIFDFAEPVVLVFVVMPVQREASRPLLSLGWLHIADYEGDQAEPKFGY